MFRPMTKVNNKRRFERFCCLEWPVSSGGQSTLQQHVVKIGAEFAVSMPKTCMLFSHVWLHFVFQGCWPGFYVFFDCTKELCVAKWRSMTLDKAMASRPVDLEWCVLEIFEEFDIGMKTFTLIIRVVLWQLILRFFLILPHISLMPYEARSSGMMEYYVAAATSCGACELHWCRMVRWGFYCRYEIFQFTFLFCEAASNVQACADIFVLHDFVINLWKENMNYN